MDCLCWDLGSLEYVTSYVDTLDAIYMCTHGHASAHIHIYELGCYL